VTRATSPTPATTSLAALVAEHAATLEAAGVPSPQHDATVLARHVLGLTTAGVRTAGPPSEDERRALAELVARRAAREPLQLVIGETWFRYLRLVCRPGVFIPRPETEVVAGLAIDAARTSGAAPLVVEPCTGTGAIACSVAAEVAGARVIATDVDTGAVDLARHNLAEVAAGRADVSGLAPGAGCRIEQGDLLGPVDDALRGRVDVLVSNPPYLPVTDRDAMPPEVARHDPPAALYGGDDGHDVVDRLLEAAATWLRPGGTVVLEIDARRADDALAAARVVGLADARIEIDLTGADRVLVARRPDHARGTT
jgi:release factor glutamine methyltransferase